MADPVSFLAGFLSKLTFLSIKNRKELLELLKEHTKNWFEEIRISTNEVRFLIEEELYDEIEEEDYRDLAKSMWNLMDADNAGNELDRILSRKENKKIISAGGEANEIKAGVERFLRAGDVLKTLGYKFSKNNIENYPQLRDKLMNQWEEFEKSKDSLVDLLDAKIAFLS